MIFFFFALYIEYFRIFYAKLRRIFRLKPSFTLIKIVHPNKESLGFPKLRVRAKQEEWFMFTVSSMELVL